MSPSTVAVAPTEVPAPKDESRGMPTPPISPFPPTPSSSHQSFKDLYVQGWVDKRKMMDERTCSQCDKTQASHSRAAPSWPPKPRRRSTMRVVVRAFCLRTFLPSFPHIYTLPACFPTKIHLRRFSKKQASPSQAARSCKIFQHTVTGEWATPTISTQL